MGKLRKISKKQWLSLILLILVLLGNGLIYVLSFKPSTLTDADTEHIILCDVVEVPLDQGKYAFAATPLAVVPAIGIADDSPDVVDANRILITEADGSIVWEKRGLYFPHSVEFVDEDSTNETVLFYTNAAIGGVERIPYPKKQEDWHWLPRRINWTSIFPSWGPDGYAMSFDGTHAYYIVNDVDYIRGENFNQTWDSLLISIKQLNLVVMVNYTAEMDELESNGDKYGDADNIYWWCGGQQPGNELSGNQGNENILIRKQHNPDRLPNGNVIVADSEHLDENGDIKSRLVEINYTTKEIEWEISGANGKEFIWAKDANYDTKTDSFIVTDTGNSRVMEIARNGTTLWEYSSADLLMPYSAELTESGSVLVSGGGTGVILEISREKNPKVLNRINFNSKTPNEFHLHFFEAFFRFNAAVLLSLVVLSLRNDYRSWKKEKRIVAEDPECKDLPVFVTGKTEIGIKIVLFVGLIVFIAMAHQAYAAIGGPFMVQQVQQNLIP